MAEYSILCDKRYCTMNTVDSECGDRRGVREHRSISLVWRFLFQRYTFVYNFPPPTTPDFPLLPQSQGICLQHLKPLKILICPSLLQPLPWVGGWQKDEEAGEGLSSRWLDLGGQVLFLIKGLMRK